METVPLSDADESLLAHATDLNARTVDTEFFDGAHIVAASVRVVDGDLFDGVSLPASIGRASTCAEPGAVSSAIAAGYSHDDIVACVAVAYPMLEHDADEARVVPPCGVCRELLRTTTPRCGCSCLPRATPKRFGPSVPQPSCRTGPGERLAETRSSLPDGNQPLST